TVAFSDSQVSNKNLPNIEWTNFQSIKSAWHSAIRKELIFCISVIYLCCVKVHFEVGTGWFLLMNLMCLLFLLSHNIGYQVVMNRYYVGLFNNTFPGVPAWISLVI